MNKPLYVPGPGVPDAIEKMPPWLALPLLFGKAHSEIHEATLAPADPEEYGDVRDVLEAIAEACGHPWEDVMAAATKAMREAPAAHGWSRPETVAMLHEAVEAAALDLGNPAPLSAALLMTARLAAIYGVDWAAVEASSAEKRARKGGFTGHMFWRPLV